MTTRVAGFALLFALLATAAFPQDAKPEPRIAGVIYLDAQPAQPPDDTYAVYSAVLRELANSKSSLRLKDKTVLIEGKTGAALGDMDPAQCLDVPAAYLSSKFEMQSDYEAHKTEVVQLEPKLALGRPYKLLSDREAKQFAASKTPWTKDLRQLAKATGAAQQLLEQATGLFTLGRVFFNKDHTAAMVLVSEWCGNMCAYQQWQVLLKRDDGTWMTVDWSHCFAIS